MCSRKSLPKKPAGELEVSFEWPPMCENIQARKHTEKRNTTKRDQKAKRTRSVHQIQGEALGLVLENHVRLQPLPHLHWDHIIR